MPGTVFKPCRYKTCGGRKYASCRHEWYFNYKPKGGRREKLPVNAFARMRGANHRITSKEDAERNWLDQFVAWVDQGKPPVRAAGSELTIGQVIEKHYRPDFVETEQRRSKRDMLSKLRGLTRVIGSLPVTALASPQPATLVKQAWAHGQEATRSGYLARLRHLTNWVIARSEDSAAGTQVNFGVTKSPFRRHGIRLNRKDENKRQRRVSPEEEQRLLKACAALDEPSGGRKLTWAVVEEIRRRVASGERQKDVALDFNINSGLCSQIINGQIWNRAAYVARGAGQLMRDRLVVALNTAFRLGELQALRTDWVDLEHHHIHVPAAHSKNKRARSIPFTPAGAVAELLERRKALGARAYVLSADGLKPAGFRAAWESVVLRANGHEPSYDRNGGLDQASRARFRSIDLRWHDLRHESASRWYERTHDLLWVSQQLLDHSSLEQTSRYLHLVLSIDRNERAARSWTTHESPVGPSGVSSTCPPDSAAENDRGSESRDLLGKVEPAVRLELTTC